jgi:hypothetical protein
MRTIDITKDLSIQIEALRRKDIKALKSAGFNVSTMSIGEVTAEQWDEFVDALVQVYAPKQAEAVVAVLDDLDRMDYRRVCLDLVAETWGVKEEEKN